ARGFFSLDKKFPHLPLGSKNVFDCWQTSRHRHLDIQEKGFLSPKQTAILMHEIHLHYKAADILNRLLKAEPRIWYGGKMAQQPT
ncbi:MAG: hypothetical protein C7B44_01415, partial [Sulfobacillus thermosulfidooxidans]